MNSQKKKNGQINSDFPTFSESYHASKSFLRGTDEGATFNSLCNILTFAIMSRIFKPNNQDR